MQQNLKTGGEAQPAADFLKLAEQSIAPSLWLWPMLAA